MLTSGGVCIKKKPSSLFKTYILLPYKDDRHGMAYRASVNPFPKAFEIGRASSKTEASCLLTLWLDMQFLQKRFWLQQREHFLKCRLTYYAAFRCLIHYYGHGVVGAGRLTSSISLSLTSVRCCEKQEETQSRPLADSRPGQQRETRA